MASEATLARRGQLQQVRSHIDAAIKDSAAAATDLIRQLKQIERLTDEATEAAAASAKAFERSGTGAGDDATTQLVKFRNHIEERFKRAVAGQAAVADISAEVDKLAKATGDIRDMAEQSYLLSINAAIEAARAGHQGSGFSVVAKAVRAQATASTAVATSIEAGVQAMGERIQLTFDRSDAQLDDERSLMMDVVERLSSTLAAQASVRQEQVKALAHLEDTNRKLNALILDTMPVIQAQEAVRQKLTAITEILECALAEE